MPPYGTRSTGPPPSSLTDTARASDKGKHECQPSRSTGTCTDMDTHPRPSDRPRLQPTADRRRSPLSLYALHPSSRCPASTKVVLPPEARCPCLSSTVHAPSYRSGQLVHLGAPLGHSLVEAHGRLLLGHGLNHLRACRALETLGRRSRGESTSDPEEEDSELQPYLYLWLFFWLS